MGSGNKAESSGGNRSEEGGEEIIGGEILSSEGINVMVGLSLVFSCKKPANWVLISTLRH